VDGDRAHQGGCQGRGNDAFGGLSPNWVMTGIWGIGIYSGRSNRGIME
jgi:hypothetical protein